jgi:hypothetical protein
MLKRRRFPLAAFVAIGVLGVGADAFAREEQIGTTEQPIKLAPSSGSPGQCKQGFVWREARPNDHVCVTPQTRAAVRDQNRQRTRLWVSGAYGPHTCVQGYVWREAFQGDDVCVAPGFREQTRRDNSEAPRRVAR